MRVCTACDSTNKAHINYNKFNLIGDNIELVRYNYIKDKE
jgi:hypothetical protein